MAVYFEPERRGGSWWDFVGSAASQAMGGMIQNQLAKSKAAREFDYG